jgi:hypothetical protein
LTRTPSSGTLADVAPPLTPPDLVRRVVDSTGLPPATAARVITDVIGYFGETAEQYVRRRHAELHARHRNDEIWGLVATELAGRLVAAPPVSARQLRRIVYG